MKVLIVYAHPELQSLNSALRDVAVHELEAQGHEVKVSDLYAMNWKSEVSHADFPLLDEQARLQVSNASKAGFNRTH
jgi:NAD(P)H dehydrogenase (quinone)